MNKCIFFTAMLFFFSPTLALAQTQMGGDVGKNWEKMKKSVKHTADDMHRTFGETFKRLIDNGDEWDEGEGMYRARRDGKTDPKTPPKKVDAALYVHRDYKGGGISGSIGTEVKNLEEYPILVDEKAKNLDKMLSSAKVFNNAKIILYAEFNFKGATLEISEDTALFPVENDSWNDRARSFRIVEKK